MIITRLEAEDGRLIAITSVSPKDFKTGSKGFYAQGRVVIDGKHYQLNIQLVEIGSRKDR
jgi:hypothetical protein